VSTTHTDTSPPQPPEGETTPGVGRLALVAGVGTSLEYYDFAIYGTAAALVFSDVFFRTDDAWFGTFMALATFAIGFVMAPVGAVVFGWIGDRRGRRTALIAAFCTMGAATLLMAVLPSYAAIGVAAPILLVLLRMFHGAARGGENVGAAVFAIEHAPAHRRGVYGSFAALGSPIGLILANLAFAAVLGLSDASLESWGWRIPFALGGVVLLVGIWVRRGVAESPASQQLQQVSETGPRSAPAVVVLRTSWRRVALCAGVNAGLTACAYVLATFMLSYATADAPEGLELPRSPIVWGSIGALVAHAAMNLGSAWLSDRWGRKPVMLVGAVLSVAAMLVVFPIAERGTVAAVNVAVLIGFTTTGVIFGPMYAYFAELFPSEHRQSGAGIAYHLGAVLGGGISPLVANRLVAATGDALTVGYYLAALVTVSVLCLIALPTRTSLAPPPGVPATPRRTSTPTADAAR